ncbi:MAG: gamma-glutamyl-gamma-aminobutyrate hydrolase family protein [Bacteroidetes bacterium]|nr:gamma-glutamyl-gamma-aminobutyrate hydrolase family protein [Bacteroidota bacterium]
MRTKIRSLLSIIIIFSFFTPTFGQNYFSIHQFNPEKNQIVLMHPTVANIEAIELMIEKKIINLPKIEIIGVFHAKEEYDYNKSIKYIKSHKLTNFYLNKINSNIGKDSIFTRNSCTKDFYNIFTNSKGIIFTGGPDIPPSIYSDKTSLLTEITDPYRHYFELSFMFHLLGNDAYPEFDAFLNEVPKYKVIAICLGMQTMNIATGGTLFQDIPSEIYNLKTVEEVLQQESDFMHKNYRMNLDPISENIFGSLHRIKFSTDSKILTKLNILDTFTPLVYSAHHQCIKKLGSNLKVEATSMDGKVIEMVSHKTFENVYGVQFHPEKSDIYENKNQYQTDKNSFQFLSEILKQKNCENFHPELWKIFLN